MTKATQKIYLITNLEIWDKIELLKNIKETFQDSNAIVNIEF